jgi:hypothetical protein
MQQQEAARVIASLLANKSVTFAQINTTTAVNTAAAYRHLNIQKHTTANVQLFANVHSDVYKLAVQRSAAKFADNTAAAIADFESSSNYFAHTDCYSIVQHKKRNDLYLYCIYNNASSFYTIDNVVATSKQQIAQYLTASDAARLLNPPQSTHNVTNNITHDVVVRTIALQNINSIHAAKQQVVF